MFFSKNNNFVYILSHGIKNMNDQLGSIDYYDGC